MLLPRPTLKSPGEMHWLLELLYVPQHLFGGIQCAKRGTFDVERARGMDVVCRTSMINNRSGPASSGRYVNFVAMHGQDLIETEEALRKSRCAWPRGWQIVLIIWSGCIIVHRHFFRKVLFVG